MTLFDTRAAEQRASQFLAPGPPTGFAENTAAAFDAVSLSETSISRELALEEAYDEYIDELFQQTGKKLPNPVPAGSIIGGPGQRIQADRLKIFGEEVEKLGVVSRTQDELLDRALSRVRSSVAENVDIAGRATTAGSVGQFVGAAGAVLRDPPVLASMILGAPASAGILRTMLIEAGIAATTEAVIQPGVQRFRAEANLPAGIAEAFRNIAFAGLAGGVFSGVVKGGVVGGRALLDRAGQVPTRTRAQRDAERFLERQVELQEATPFDISIPSARAEHDGRLSRAQSDLAEAAESSGLFRIPDEPQSPIRPELRQPTLRAADAPGVTEDLSITGEAFDLGQGARQEALGRLGDAEQQRVAREIARELLGLPGLEDLLDVVRRPPRAPRAQSLIEFLRREGGLRDQGGELRGLGITGRTRPGLISRRGLPLDEAALRAGEAGFFPELAGERPTINQLLNTLDEEFNRGRPRLTEEGQAILEDFDQISRGIDELRRALDDLGIDVERISNEAVQEQIQNIAAAPIEETPATLRQTGAVRELAAEASRLESQADVMDDALEADLRDALGLQRQQRAVPESERGVEGERILSGEIVDETGPQPAFRMSAEEIEALLDEKQLSDRDKLVKALGSEEAADDFERLDRKQNSSNPKRADEGAEEFDAKFGDLTPEQERLIFGVGETDLTVEELKGILRARNEVDALEVSGDPLDDLGFLFTKGMRSATPEEFRRLQQEGAGPGRVQEAFVRVTGALEDVRRRGISDADLNRLIIDRMEKIGFSPDDALEVLSTFLGKRGQPERSAGTLELTDQGEQRVIPGAERISDKDLAERRLEEPLRAGREQKPPDEGLFDVAGRGQEDLLDQEFLFGEGDELTPRTAREVFDELEQDEELLRNWEDCLKGAFGE